MKTNSSNKRIDIQKVDLWGPLYFRKHIRGIVYRFNGKELDEETGLAYYGARYYDNQISQWLSVDRMASKYPHSSPYVFSGNNPVMLVDPDGNENVIYLVVMPGAANQVTPEQLNAIVTRANGVLDSRIGVQTRVVLMNDGASFDPSKLDATDSFSLIATAEDVKAFNEKYPSILNAGIQHDRLSLEMADPATDPSYSDGLIKGDGSVISIAKVIHFAIKSGEPLTEVITWALLHGSIHNAIPTNHEGNSDLGGHLNGTIMAPGAEVSANVLGGTYYDDDAGKYYTGSGQLPLAAFFRDTIDHIIQSYMEQTYGVQPARANYNNTQDTVILPNIQTKKDSVLVINWV